MSPPWESLLDSIRGPRTRIAKGLTRTELSDIQQVLGFAWPPDLCEMLAAGLPMGPDWPNWRKLARAGSLKSNDGHVRYINERLQWPLEGMLFDLERNSFWDSEWGERPATLSEAKSIAIQAFQAAPPLIPIYIHRYLPTLPLEPGNPVFSIHQMDIIIYGSDLPTYLANEFLGVDSPNAQAKNIRCWTRWMQIGR